MVAINSNPAAAQTASALYRNDRIIDGIIERLSTGKRINSAADDPAGLAISTRLTSQVNGLIRRLETPTTPFLWYRLQIILLIL